MPGFDRTGPLGTGPVGKRMGPCKGSMPDPRTGMRGFGLGRGFRCGGGYGWRISPLPLTPEDNKSILERQKNWLQSQLEVILQKLQELDQ